MKFQLSCFTIIIFPLFIFLFGWNKNPVLAFILFYYAVYKVQNFWKRSFSLTVLPTVTVFLFIKEIIALNQCCLIKLWKNFSLKSVLKKGTCDLCKLVYVSFWIQLKFYHKCSSPLKLLVPFMKKKKSTIPFWYKKLKSLSHRGKGG